MVEVECSKCGNLFEGKTKKKAMKELMKHAKKHHSKKDIKKIFRNLKKL